MKPILFPSPIKHRNFVNARRDFLRLVKTSPGGKIVVLTGPTQIGKSLIFDCLVDDLSKSLRTDNPAKMPFIFFIAATSQDGRISPKHITLTILKVLRHPMYMHIGELDEQNFYTPSRGKDEGTMRIAADMAMDARGVEISLIDEAHHLTHTKDRGLSSNVLQSIKCLTAIKRTLAAVGGYELVCRGLFDSAHFVGRVVVVELAPYVSTDESDVREWLKILKAFSTRLSLTPKSLLLTHASELMEATNGCFGLLEKLLWRADALADGAISLKQLRAAFPTQNEHNAVRRDIIAGRKALAEFRAIENNFPGSPIEASSAKNERRKAFHRKPNRILKAMPKVATDE